MWANLIGRDVRIFYTAICCQSRLSFPGVIGSEEKERMSLRKHKKIDYSKMNGEDSSSTDLIAVPRKKSERKANPRRSPPVYSLVPDSAIVPKNPSFVPSPTAPIRAVVIPQFFNCRSEFNPYSSPSPYSTYATPRVPSQLPASGPSFYVQPAFPPSSSGLPFCVVPTPLYSLPVPTARSSGVVYNPLPSCY